MHINFDYYRLLVFILGIMSNSTIYTDVHISYILIYHSENIYASFIWPASFSLSISNKAETRNERVEAKWKVVFFKLNVKTCAKLRDIYVHICGNFSHHVNSVNICTKTFKWVHLRINVITDIQYTCACTHTHRYYIYKMCRYLVPWLN